jgi:hypothetical protein
MDTFAAEGGVPSLPPSVELLSYYRSRIEEFEKEREHFLERFSVIEVRYAAALSGWSLRASAPL